MKAHKSPAPSSPCAQSAIRAASQARPAAPPHNQIAAVVNTPDKGAAVVTANLDVLADPKGVAEQVEHAGDDVANKRADRRDDLAS
jgi:hypothetical protein